jgi:hypothetical protein
MASTTKSLRSQILERAKPKVKTDREKTSLYLSKPLMDGLREDCEKRGVAMSKVLEELIRSYLGK